MTRDDEGWRRSRRLAEVFGDSEPATTTDERPDSDSAEERRGQRDREAWLRDQIPPHHGS
ncbi:hypothetical protein [Nocardioides acrostichi]|uniref:hypothetical protein n=1 Tax=Nocardioides acrostichi TaxID=2784339 RepID=UPI001A9CA20C|nr:hypothetical protein [Nocardioides acrostichi]